MALIRENYTRDAGVFLADTFPFQNPDGSPRNFDNCTSTLELHAKAGDGAPLATISTVASSNGYIGFDANGNGWFFVSGSLLKTLGQSSSFLHIVWIVTAADAVTQDALLTATLTLLSR